MLKYAEEAETQTIFLSRFEQQVKKYRHKKYCAVKFRGKELTYKRLDEKANQLAHYLISLALPKHSIIALCLPNSPDLVVCQFAIWKAGHAFMALDTLDPRTVLSYRIQDSGAALVIANSKTRLKLRHLDVPEIYYDEIKLDAQNCSTQKPKITIHEQDLAYVIYTSGSTGLPKGVALSHAGLLPCMEAHVAVFKDQPITQTDVMAQLARSSFDASMAELLILGTGGCLAIVPPEIRTNAFELQQYYQQYGITLGIFTPGHLKLLGTPDDFPKLRGIFIVGEAFDKAFARQWKRPHNQLVNGYGLTETTICVTLQLLDDRHLKGDGYPSLGLPIPSASIRLSDQSELLVEGKCLAIGYIGHASALNEKKFTTIDGVRYYGTGDIVEQLCNGEYRYVSRNDRQIKLRGQRIELDEIERMLETHADIAKAVVDASLNCFLVCQDPEDVPSSDRIRRYAQDCLPSGFTLGLIEFYRQLPDAANVNDRHHLMISRSRSLPGQHNIVAFQIAEIWRDLLHLDRQFEIALEDNFYQLGGNSLLIGELASRLDQQLHVDVKPHHIFRFQTLGDQVRMIRILEKPDCIIQKINHIPDAPTLFCVHSLLGKTQIDFESLQGALGWNIRGLSLMNMDGNMPFPHDLESFAECYALAIYRTQPHEPYFIAGLSVGSAIAVATARILEDHGMTAYVHLLDGMSPTLIQKMPLDQHARFLAKLARKLGARADQEDFQDLRASNTLESQISKLIAMVDGVLPNRQRQFVESLLLGCCSYRPKTSFPDMILYKARESDFADPSLGWDALRETVLFPGDHFSFMQDTDLPEALGQRLNKQYRNHLASELVFRVQYTDQFYIEPYMQCGHDSTLYLTKGITEFLRNDQKKILLLQGESGIGKSTALKFLTRNLTSIGIDVESILLSHYSAEESRTIVNEKISRWSKHSSRLRVVLLDAYDELSAGERNFNIYTENHLSDWDNLKVIISCRSENLIGNYQAFFYPDNESGLADYTLCPFNELQRKRYIEHVLSENIILRQHTRKLALIERQDELREMIGNPLMLGIVLESLPCLEIQNTCDGLNRWALYRAFTMKLLGREEKKQIQALGASNGDLLLHIDASNYCEELALCLFVSDKTVHTFERGRESQGIEALLDEYVDPERKERLQHASDNLLDRHLRADGFYELSFKHKSLLEFFAASAIIRLLADPNRNMRRIIRQVEQFGLHSKLLSKNDHVSHFMHDRLHVNRDEVGFLKDNYRRSAKDPDLAAVAGLSLSVLVKSGVELNSENFSGAHIRDADLSGGFFDHANFENAVLTQVDFSDAWIFGVDFQRCDMTDVDFGQWPHYEHDSDVNGLAWFPEKAIDRLYAAANNQVWVWSPRERRVQTRKSLRDVSMINYLDMSVDRNFLITANRAESDRSLLLLLHLPNLIQRSLVGHTDTVNFARFSPVAEDERLVSASDDGSVKIWAYRDRTVITTYKCHTQAVLVAVFSPDATKVASSGIGGDIHIWFSQGARPYKILSGHDLRTSALDFSKNGELLVSGGRDDVVRIWNVDRGEVIRELREHAGEVLSVRFSPSGRYLATGSLDYNVCLWDARTFHKEAVLKGHYGPVTCLQFSQTEKSLASGSWDNHVRIWSTKTRNNQMLFHGHDNSITHISVSADNQRIASLSWDKTIRIWDFKTGKQLNRLEQEYGWAICSCFSECGEYLYVGDQDGKIRIRHIESGLIPERYKEGVPAHNSPIRGIALCDFRTKVITLCDDGVVRIWDPKDAFKQVQNIDTKAYATCFFVNENERHVIVGGRSCHVSIWHLDTGELLYQLDGEKMPKNYGTVNCLKMSLDGSTVFIGTKNNNILSWEYEKDRLNTIGSHKHWVTSLAQNVDGQRLITASKDRTVQVWSLKTNSVIYQMSFLEGCLLKTCQDGKHFIVASGTNLYLLRYEHSRLLLTWCTASHNAQLNCSRLKFAGAVGVRLKNSLLTTGSGTFLNLAEKLKPGLTSPRKNK